MTDDPIDATQLEISLSVAIPLAEFAVEYVRASGPGGQNVNKVSSKARLRWPVAASPSLPDDVKARFLARYRSRLTNDGELILVGQKFRDQRRNHDDCLARLRDLVRAVLAPPAVRKATKPSKGAHRRRLAEKRSRSETKRLRGKPGPGE